MLMLMNLLQATDQAVRRADGLGLEWMVIASILVPAVLLLAIVLVGMRIRVK